MKKKSTQHQKLKTDSAVFLTNPCRPSSWNPTATWRKYRNRLGVRAMINQLVLAPDGRAELKKLLGWFDAQGTAVELAVLEHFARAS
ncbi:hypothetical protein LJR143_001467 [Pseudoxanthomonas sp. LjRoot143]|uniref:hypothetical protein n=1 Tax=Pseudoxanthomonas sp. LjRoot143 TaxID=3342266 RepID=UPI003ECC3C22